MREWQGVYWLNKALFDEVAFDRGVLLKESMPVVPSMIG